MFVSVQYRVPHHEVSRTYPPSTTGPVRIAYFTRIARSNLEAVFTAITSFIRGNGVWFGCVLFLTVTFAI